MDTPFSLQKFWSGPCRPYNELPIGRRGSFKRLTRMPARQRSLTSLGCLETVLFEMVQNRWENDQNRQKSPKSARRVRLESKCFFISAWWPGSLLKGPSENFHCTAPSLVPMYEIWIKQYIHFQLIHASKSVLVGKILIILSKLPTKIFSLQKPITRMVMSSETDF